MSRLFATPIYATYLKAVNVKLSLYLSMLASVCGVFMAFGLLYTVPSIAIAYEYANSSNNTMAQPKIRWYRYYNSNGQPSLSSTITDQHLKYGYEALDRNMQVVKRASPYSADSYAVQKAKRDAQEAKRQSDLSLKKTYGSATQAAAKRDQILADMGSRKVYLQAQLTSLQRALGSDIAQAAVFERQGKSIPAGLQKSLDTNRKNVADAEQNIRAISERQQQVRQEYEEIIRRLNRI